MTNKPNKKIYLASKSPRRKELLQQIGVDFDIISAEIDETPHLGEMPEDFVLRMAIQKAQAGYAASTKKRPTLGSDTVVVVDGEIFGKPLGQNDSIRMLTKLSGRLHYVYTSVAIALENSVIFTTNRTIVTFKQLDRDEILTYIETGEPADKAGSYAIQGLAARFISNIDGSYSGVMGLPVFETAQLLDQI
ncbi:MAG: septum formation inhibitor Maf [Gammaproteobacteria bacterium]|nr:MAG: septum formation inhibitor Maf [Gammaproteobacteria bacterium]